MSVLYRKYRPQTFKDVEGQEHVVQTLQGTLATKRVGHAYLFCGTRGTGKTTMARLFAKALNCTALATKTFASISEIEPCNACASCTEINEGRSMDLIEIDAASNRGIDDIRSIKDSTNVASTASTYKIFIVDEVHMLTPQAFNALLKVLEEPPKHVIFILATTESHKILDTILSRVQRFDFKKIPATQLIHKLTKIAETENLAIEPPVYDMLATLSGGSLRDAESAFAKLISYAGATITAQQASDILGIVPTHTYETIISLLTQKNAKAAIEEVNKLYEAGINMEHFTDQFIRYLRTTLIAHLQKPGTTPIDLLVKMIRSLTHAKQELKLSPIPQLPLELAMIELIPHGTIA